MKKGLSVIVLILAITASAEMPQCSDDLAKFCSASKFPRESMQCLREHESELTPDCREQLQRITQMIRNSLPGGNAMMGAMLGGGGMPGAGYTGSFTGGSLSMQQHRVNASMPVYRDGGDTYSVSTNAGLLHLEHPVTLSNGVVLPPDYYRLEFGGQFSRRLDNRRNLGLRFSGGSASDRPFGSFDELTFALSGTFSFPEGEHGNWTVFVFVANNTSFANYIPIPGFMYIYRRDNFTGMFGLPFGAIVWSPDQWSLSFSFFGPFVNAEVAHGNRDTLQGFVGFNWGQLSHLRYERKDDRDRVFLDEKKVFVGARFPILSWLAGDVQLGHAFSRSLYERQSILKTGGGKADLPAAWYVQANVRLAM